MGGDSSWQDAYSDPLRCRPDGSAQEVRNCATPRVEEIQNDLCSVKLVMMHRPTHEPQREKSGEYPFSWHLADKKRLWELRLQIKFRVPPKGRVFFGIELDRFVPVSGMTKQAQKALVSTCKGVVGDCYHTIGDDPSMQGEREAPAFVMPLWAFDQFHEANAGNEPPLDADLSGVGHCRTEGASKYISALKAVIQSFSTDKVYTFCFWGISRFLDIMKWQVIGGLLPGVKLDFNQLCGAPPIYMTIYELNGISEQDKDQRHLASRKKQYFRAAVWSELAPPGASGGEAPAAAAAAAGGASGDYWADMYGDFGSYEHPTPAAGGSPASSGMDDLLGLDDPIKPAAAAAEPAAAAPAKQAESTDLLGLF